MFFSKRERERWGRLSKMKRGNRYMHRDSPKNTQKKLFKNQRGEFLVESKKKEIEFFFPADSMWTFKVKGKHVLTKM